jgi:hypothetical protein
MLRTFWMFRLFRLFRMFRSSGMGVSGRVFWMVQDGCFGRLGIDVSGRMLRMFRMLITWLRTDVSNVSNVSFLDGCFWTDISGRMFCKFRMFPTFGNVTTRPCEVKLYVYIHIYGF